MADHSYSHGPRKSPKLPERLAVQDAAIRILRYPLLTSTNAPYVYTPEAQGLQLERAKT